jgi:hypothetical protein
VSSIKIYSQVVIFNVCFGLGNDKSFSFIFDKSSHISTKNANVQVRFNILCSQSKFVSKTSSIFLYLNLNFKNQLLYDKVSDLASRSSLSIQYLTIFIKFFKEFVSLMFSLSQFKYKVQEFSKTFKAISDFHIFIFS